MGSRTFAFLSRHARHENLRFSRILGGGVLSEGAKALSCVSEDVSRIREIPKKR